MIEPKWITLTHSGRGRAGRAVAIFISQIVSIYENPAPVSLDMPGSIVETVRGSHEIAEERLQILHLINKEYAK